MWEFWKYVSWNIWAWSSKVFSEPVLAWKAALENTKLKLDLLIDIDMLLMMEKGIRGGKYLQYWDANDLYGWETLQKLPVNKCEWF